MEQKPIDNELAILQKMIAVEAPPFLLTRIKQRIVNAASEEVPRIWKLQFAVVGVLVLVLNVSLFLKAHRQSDSEGIWNVVNGMNLSTNNSLYK